MRRYGNCIGIAGVAFGAGLLAATFCPPQLILVLAAVALILIGCARIRAC